MELTERIEDAYTSKCLRIFMRELPAAAPLFEAELLEDFGIIDIFNDSWPSFIEKCHTLKTLRLHVMHVGKLTEFPPWIHNAVSLQHLSIELSEFTFIPDWIGELKFLTELSIYCNRKLKTIPDSIGNLINLTELHFNDNEHLKVIPYSVGNLKNLVKLDLSSSPIENLPDSIVNCTSLEYVDIRQTNIITLPNIISSVKTVKRSVELIPKEHSISYRAFCNCYYKLAETIIGFSDKSRKDGLLSLEDAKKDFSDDFFCLGIGLIVDGNEEEIIRHILTLRIEREHGYYRRKLMEIAMEGILCIQRGANTTHTASILAALVNIENNPLDAVLTKVYTSDWKWPKDIDLKAAIQPEEEREEVRFIKRAIALGKIARERNWLDLEKHIDHDGIAAKDIFEIGLTLVVNGTERKNIDQILSILITHETDPVRKNLALAKKAAVLMIHNGDFPIIIKTVLFAYFDDSITKDLEDFIYE